MPGKKGEVHRQPRHNWSYEPVYKSAQQRNPQNRTKDETPEERRQSPQQRHNGQTPQKQRRNCRHKQQVFNHVGAKQSVGKPIHR
jgi:hypothetical protein